MTGRAFEGQSSRIRGEGGRREGQKARRPEGQKARRPEGQKARRREGEKARRREGEKRRQEGEKARVTASRPNPGSPPFSPSRLLALLPSYDLTAFLSAEPALKRGTRLAAIWIRSPVWGFTPWRAPRSATLNLPKPVKLTSPPRDRVSWITVSTASTASPASFLPRPELSATWSTNSCLVTCSSLF